MGLFGLFKKKAYEAFDPSSCPADDILFDRSYLIVGYQYNCKKRPALERQYVIRSMHVGDTVHIEEYVYQRKAAFMITNPRNGLDLGVLSSGAADLLSHEYPNTVKRAILDDEYNGSFHVRIVILKSDNPDFVP